MLSRHPEPGLALFTDQYELSMLQSYRVEGMDGVAVFHFDYEVEGRLRQRPIIGGFRFGTGDDRSGFTLYLIDRIADSIDNGVARLPKSINGVFDQRSGAIFHPS